MTFLEKVEIYYPETENIKKMKGILKKKHGDDVQFTVEKHTVTQSQQEWSMRGDGPFTTYHDVTRTWLICEK